MQTFQVLIIGSGFGGQCAAINLLKAGIDDFRLLERRDFFGGTGAKTPTLVPRSTCPRRSIRCPSRPTAGRKCSPNRPNCTTTPSTWWSTSACETIPTIAPDVEHLHVFQRTPHWVLPRADRAFGPFQRWLLGLKPAYKLLRWMIYWQFETRVIAFKYSKPAIRLVQQHALRFLKRQVPDPQLRQKLTPDYVIGCKRVIISSTLYPALGRSNVSLHSREQGIAAIDETGIVTRDGQHIDLDLIVWSTGYDATDGVISYPVTGKNGTQLKDFWARYPRAYLGTSLPDFPNLFIVTGPNTGIGHTSALFIIESQMNYILDCIRTLKEHGLRSIEVRPEAERTYTEMIHREMERTVWKSGGCHSWYQSKSGHVIAMFPGFSFSYHRLTRALKPADHILS